MKPGEIYWVDLATGRRPGIVVSRESLNERAIGDVIDSDCEPN
jgi:mRNA-degrading endonuclease toxin of MazEF toxin-antitoxin module